MMPSSSLSIRQLNLIFQSFLFTCIGLSVLHQASDAKAQMFGMPAPVDTEAWKEITACLPESEPIACTVWNASGALNPEGNPSDRWYADPDIQKALGKLKQAIATVAQEQGTDTLGRLAEDVGWKLLSKAGVVYLEDVFLDRQSANAALIIKLGKDEKAIKELLIDAMAETEFKAFDVGEGVAYDMSPTGAPLVVGVHSGFLVGTIGEGYWKATVARIVDSESPPEWINERMEATPFARRSQFSFANIESIMGLIPGEIKSSPEFARISSALALEEIKSISLGNGADQTSNVSKIYLECEKAGLTSIFDVPAIKMEKLEEMPQDSIMAAAIRFSPATAMELVESLVPAEEMIRAKAEFTENTGLDLRTDIVEQLEGSVRYYQSGSIISPKQVAIVKLKNETKFNASMERINEIMIRIAESEGLEFVEQEKKGLKTYGIKNVGLSAYWGVHKGELYISTNSRAIASHIRKASKSGNRSVMDAELNARILSDAKSSGFEGPIAVQYYDLDQITETVVPMIQGALQFIPPEAAAMIDFGSEDFPPIESLLGLRPTGGMLFKSDNGYIIISRYDTPIPLDLSSVAFTGVAVGMMLPAVQATREAARRTQSMNNQRQLALSLLNYEAATGSFPPAYTVDADGNPLLSWRVAILPYLGEQELYDKFHHDEPWDSDHNIKLLGEMPLSFTNPSSMPQAEGYTDYVAPVGEDSILALGGGLTVDAVADGLSSTILVMEVGTPQQVPWSAPMDIDLTTLTDLNFENGHPGTIIITMGDGSVHNISKSTLLEDLIGISNKSDGVDASGVLGW